MESNQSKLSSLLFLCLFECFLLVDPLGPRWDRGLRSGLASAMPAVEDLCLLQFISCCVDVLNFDSSPGSFLEDPGIVSASVACGWNWDTH